MNFNQKLEQNKKQIIDQWFLHTINSYPQETARVLGKLKNRFDNPVGSATAHSLEESFNLLLQKEIDIDKIETALDSIIRIRAVQSFSASQAVGFVFELKKIIKTVLEGERDNDFDGKIDEMALAAFNRFMKCRENIFLLKATESKRRIHSAFERAGLVTELKEKELLDSDKS
ncbi:RsbT co-antagonist protein rsbRD N-terminal domain-containing protein [Desulfocicer vacuolatum DSM 3385]|uniref:RsbT co-antagonist protein rsbRD N-terminal domain-containing protein n=1 Tax=Desulfocicer vacuolatum DSM 3385 TaxID=1121400 RepID=A0A1W2D9I7_9BACT|nr:RsbRD N-terminal domain-containing protein [Desulfocicer vacuolatum]SMC94149.1 RsbT co-antagonist protein rsbRD N-terminal domain-containing protein [Desulfocicer vacuolatum DSM 3385]